MVRYPNVVPEPDVTEKVVRNAVQKIKNNKAVEPNEVMVDQLKVLGEKGI